MITALVLTIFWECSAAGFLGISKFRNYLIITLVNLLTNPAVNLVSLLLWKYIPGIPKLVMYLLLEPAVVYVEYLLYRKYLRGIDNPLYFALILNLVSILGGELCLRLF